VEVWGGYDSSSGSMVEPRYSAEHGWESFTVKGPPDSPTIVYPDGCTVEDGAVMVSVKASTDPSGTSSYITGSRLTSISGGQST